MKKCGLQFLTGQRFGRGRSSGGTNAIVIAIAAAAGFLLGGACTLNAAILTPSDVFMSAFHAPRLANAGVPETRANAFTVLTNGVVDRGAVDRIDTWNSDDLGNTLDFVGLQYASPNRFDSITIELGNQFGDGGDWETMPNVYILKNPTLVGESTEPNMSPNWVQVTGATETAAHVFTPIVVPGSPTTNGTIRLDLSAIPAAARTGWGWAVGGVDGNQNSGGLHNFISLTEVVAEGEAAAAPSIPAPSLTPVPSNVVTNAFNSTGRNGDGKSGPWRGQILASITNGVVDHANGQDGYDTWHNDGPGTTTDFVGLVYPALYRFDRLTVELGQQFGDGGDWETTPRVFVLKNPVDTNTASPESDPNWVELVGVSESTGHSFSSLVTPGPGGTVSFDLSSFAPALRSGYGWAIGGVDGNQNANGVFNFISVTEVLVSGELVPEPGSLVLACMVVAAGIARRRRIV
ncbi:MAG TPA: PEP-CTERM sorting domain-containing protein [Lacipirellulaceae bacterium]|nr:PEP-CTERM sorting domain-containing protein [Lacipirellulaceae bacterium]